MEHTISVTEPVLPQLRSSRFAVLAPAARSGVTTWMVPWIPTMDRNQAAERSAASRRRSAGFTIAGGL
jgi:hypothetical protein